MSVTWSLHCARNIAEQRSGVLNCTKKSNNNKYKVLDVVIWKYKEESICMNTRRITRRLFLFRYNVTQAGKDRTRNASLLGNRNRIYKLLREKTLYHHNSLMKQCSPLLILLEKMCGVA